MGKGKFCFPLLLPCQSIKTLKLRGSMLCPRESALSQHVPVYLRSQCCHQLDAEMEGECPAQAPLLPSQGKAALGQSHLIFSLLKRGGRAGLALPCRHFSEQVFIQEST